jgi:enoyl-CoA hydratase/carnithine racemase
LISQSDKYTSEQHAAVFHKLSDVLRLIRANVEVPVIAQVHAGAYAAGCQLVAACDMAVSARSAEFGVPGVKLGLFCATPSVAVARAARANQKRVFELLVTGSAISAEDAERIGLIGRVVEPASLVTTVEQIAARICEQSRSVIAHGKLSYYAQLACGEDLQAAYSLAEKAMCDNLRLPDGKAGVQAFLQKRKPKWTQ